MKIKQFNPKAPAALGFGRDFQEIISIHNGASLARHRTIPSLTVTLYPNRVYVDMGRGIEFLGAMNYQMKLTVK